MSMPFEKERVCECVCVVGVFPGSPMGWDFALSLQGPMAKKKKNKERESMGEENKTEQ